MHFAVPLFFALVWSSVPAAWSDAGDIVSVYSADAIPIRLRGGTSSAGRVEVFYNGQWGTICDDGFDIDDATVICRQLGFKNATTAYTNAHFGEGADPIWLSDLACTGTEESLKDCHGGWGAVNCKHEEDAGVECDGTPSTTELFQTLNDQANALIQQAGIVEGQQTTITTMQQELAQLVADVPTLLQASTLQNNDISELQQLMGTLDYKVDELNDMAVYPIRLVGGNVSTGRVEVWHDGQWGTICDDNWDINDARVVCKQLGYKDAVSAYSQAAFGEGTGPILMDSVGCTGSEPHLSACPHQGWAVHDCKHEEDAGVGCLYQDPEAAFSAGLTRSSLYPGSNYIIPFNQVYTNIGNHYSSSTGRFTAPVSGYYFFVFNGYTQYLSSYSMYIDFMINTGVYKSQWVYDADGDDSYDTASNSIIVHLNQNDYVSIRLRSGYGMYGYERTTFSGFLLHYD